VKPIDSIDLGLLSYKTAWEIQQAIQAKIIEEKLEERRSGSSTERSPDVLLFVEHPHVFTLGKSGKLDHLLADDQRLAHLGAEFFRNDRGGDITYHGPGQIVGYPIMDLDRHFTDIHRYLRSLEEVAIRTCADYGIQAGRIEGLTGVWIGDAKICAFGVKCSRWVTMHGFAFNVDPNLDYFDAIVPCGIRDHSVTSLAKVLGYNPGLDEVKLRLRLHFAEIFQREIRPLEALPESLQAIIDFK
jgi:lipoyl(octanoyl) transferase